LLNNSGTYLDERGRYTDVKPLYERALAIFEKAQGLEHTNVAISLNNLALLYRTQGQYAKAEPLYGRGAEDFGKGLGRVAFRGELKASPLARSTRPVADSLNLATLYFNQGQYAKAEPLFRRALTILEKALGPDHPDVATSLEHYALCLRAMDRSQEAEPLEARGEHFKLGATRPSSQFPSLVRFAFPDTSERRSLGVDH
jgi:tetratricopeptide (TPR) repeat protein